MNKQVDRIIAAYKYQKHQDMADSIDTERERVEDVLSSYRLEKQPDGTFRRVQHIKDSNIEII